VIKTSNEIGMSKTSIINLCCPRKPPNIEAGKLTIIKNPNIPIPLPLYSSGTMSFSIVINGTWDSPPRPAPAPPLNPTAPRTPTRVRYSRPGAKIIKRVLR